MLSRFPQLNLLLMILVGGVLGCSENASIENHDSPSSLPSTGGTGFGLAYSVDVEASPVAEGDSGDSPLESARSSCGVPSL